MIRLRKYDSCENTSETKRRRQQKKYHHPK
jgi:hypothetical protein